jgi:hypothetical protein
MANQTVSAAVPYADVTQKIANGFPDWHVARRQRDSLAAKILNATTGNFVSQFREVEFPNFVSQRHISLANPNSNYGAFTVDVSRAQIYDKVENYLRNSNFSLWSNLVRLPDYWRMKTDDWEDRCLLVYGDDDYNYIGGICMILQASNTDDYYPWGTVEFYQDYEVPEDDGEFSWSAFVHHRSRNLEDYNSSFYKFFIRFYFDDNSTEYAFSYLPNSPDWRKTKVSLKTSSNRKIVKIRVGVSFIPLADTADFAAYVDNFMLYKGTDTTSWNSNPLDKRNFIAHPQSNIRALSTYRNTEKSFTLTEVFAGEANKSLMPSSVNARTSTYEPIPPLPDVIDSPVSLPNAYWHDGKEYLQSAIVSTAAVATHYGWPLWTVGRIVKFNPLDYTEIFGTYYPSFPIVDPLDESEEGKYTYTSSVTFTCMKPFKGKLWAFGQYVGGYDLRHVGKYMAVLVAFPMNLPKQGNQEDEVDYQATPMYVPIEQAYIVEMAGGLGFGDIPYGEDPYGGGTDILKFKCQTMEFVDNDSIKLRMEGGIEGILDLNYDYFVNLQDSGEIAVLRNFNTEMTKASVLVT